MYDIRWPELSYKGVRPISLLRVSKLRLVDSNFPAIFKLILSLLRLLDSTFSGNSLWT